MSQPSLSFLADSVSRARYQTVTLQFRLRFVAKARELALWFSGNALSAPHFASAGMWRFAR
jgi:hypothetical protein